MRTKLIPKISKNAVYGCTYILFILYLLYSALSFCNVMVAMMNRSYPRYFRETYYGSLKGRHTRTFVFGACIYVRIRAYDVTCQKMTEATA